jgi:hypothetical protein
VREFHGDYHSSSSISSYAYKVGTNRWKEKLAYQVEDYVRVLVNYTEPHGLSSELIGDLRHEGTSRATTWDEWWARARPVWNQWWEARDSGGSREDLRNISHERRGFEIASGASPRAVFRITEPAGRIGRILVDGSVRVEGRIPIDWEEPVAQFAVEILFDDCLVWRTEIAPKRGKEVVFRVREPTPDERRAGDVELIEVSGAWWTASNPCPAGATLHGTPVPPMPLVPPAMHVVACRKSDGSLHGSETIWTIEGDILSEKHYVDGKEHGVQTIWQSTKLAYWLGDRLYYFRRPGCR